MNKTGSKHLISIPMKIGFMIYYILKNYILKNIRTELL